MLSRVANSLFWLARYLERAENSARFLSVTHSYAQELRGVSHSAADQCWQVAYQVVAADSDPDDRRSVFRRLSFDESLPNSVISCIAQARDNARGIRDAISHEMWEELNILYFRLQEAAAAPPSETTDLSMLYRTRNVGHLIQGMRDNTLERSDEWHFLCLGQFLERAGMTGRSLAAMYGHPALQSAAEAEQNIDALHLAATLRASSAFEACSRSGQALTPARVAEFLLLEARFPRSVEFCVQEVGYSLHALSGAPLDMFTNEAEQRCGRLVAELRFAGIEEIMSRGVGVYLGEVLFKIDELGRAIMFKYFP